MGHKCAMFQRRLCSGCRLQTCLENGMKANYVRELNIKRIRRRISKIAPSQRLFRLSETLDPFQENFLSVIEGFWIVYRNCPNTSNEINLLGGYNFPDFIGKRPFIHQTTSDSIAIIGAKMKKVKIPDCSFDDIYQVLSIVKDCINFQVLIMNILLTAIPTIR